jgi:hypothetical protein
MALPPVIDGYFDDWVLNEGVLLDATTASTVRPTSVPPPTPEDISARIWASWDDELPVHRRPRLGRRAGIR